MKKNNNIPIDYRVILDAVKQGSTILDLGCGEGRLLSLLVERNNCRGQGIEINKQKLYKAIASGLSVISGDIDTGLAEYGDNSFDYVILNQSLQEVMHIEAVLNDALRVGKNVIIGIPNIAYVRARLQFFFKGRTPVTDSLPYKWYDTPNLHFVTIKDFREYCGRKNIKVKYFAYTNINKKIKLLPNLFAKNGIFMVERRI